MNTSAERSTLVNHHDNLRELQRSAATGCFVCGPLHRLKPHWPYKFEFLLGGQNHWGIFYSELKREYYQRAGYFYCRKVDGISHPRQQCAKIRVFDLRKAQQWLQSCLEHHECCQSSRAKTFVPSRLLSLSPSQLKETPEWRLVNTKGQRKYAKYATLSYCVSCPFHC